MKKVAYAIIGVLLLTAGLLAHHSHGMFYDLNQQVILKGKVSKIVFGAPHVIVTMETKNSGVWDAELTSPENLARQGVKEDTIRVGDVLEVVGSPAWNPNSRVVDAVWEIRRPADGWRWVGSEWPGPRVIQ